MSGRGGPRRALLLGAAVAAAAATSACRVRRGEPLPLHVVAAPAGPDTRLSLVPAPGLEINARLAPALELPGGAVLRFTTGRRTADSAYFAEPPSARLPGRHSAVHGTLRASVCRTDEQVCRTITLDI